MKLNFSMLALVLLSMSLALSACGKRGGPFPPENSDVTFPKQYPKKEDL